MKRKDYSRLCAVFNERKKFYHMMQKIDDALDSEEISRETKDLIYEIYQEVEQQYLIISDEKYDEEMRGIRNER